MTWHALVLWVTHLGNSVLLLATALALLLWLLAGQAWSAAIQWSIALASAVLLVLASKIAFLGWGLGIAALDFTGVSGHAMLATAVLPALVAAVVLRAPSRVAATGVGLACAVALAVGWSRMVLGAHSFSEVVTGWGVGAAVAWVAIRALIKSRPSLPSPWPLLAMMLVPLYMTAPQEGRGPETHDLVVDMALWVSGRTEPFHRSILHP